MKLITPNYEYIKGSVGLIYFALTNDNVAVFKLFVRKYYIPIYKCACAHPGNNLTIVRYIDIA